MPMLPSSDYQSPWFLPGGHFQTIAPSLLRKAPRVTDEKERLELADGDFLDLEWCRQEESSRLVILCHGLEANAGASYVQELAGVFSRKGWDVLAWSYRGCSGEMNRLPRFYHSGATEDLAAVVTHAIANHSAKKIDLIGFSMGGNLILKYLGEQSEEVPSRLNRAVTFSVPCDLACSAGALDTAFNREIYMRRFIKSLRKKVREKSLLFPERLNPDGLEKIRTFREFDTRYTAPLHGFVDAEDYWRSSSSRPFLEKIRIPTLLVNAENDPFLGPQCYPQAEAEANQCFNLEIPLKGGHVGFPGRKGDRSWMAERAVRFLSE